MVTSCGADPYLDQHASFQLGSSLWVRRAGGERGLSLKFMHFNALQPYDTTNSTRSSSPIALGPLLLGICRVPGRTCRKILPYGSPVPSREATWSSSNEVVGELPPTLHMFLRKSGSISSLLVQSLGRSPMVLSFCTVQFVLYLRTGPWHGGCQQDFFRTTKVLRTAQASMA
jgi:hypothetical protein